MTCLCVLPIKVELRFGIALYTFFTLVPELAQDIASGVFMNQSQVRVMGANAAPDDPEKTVVFIDLVPLGPKFDNATAFLVFERFCNKQVIINPVHFGKYDVLYVLYQGESSPQLHVVPLNIIFLIILASSTFLADLPVFDLEHNSFCVIQVISSFFALFSVTKHGCDMHRIIYSCRSSSVTTGSKHEQWS